MADSIKIGSLDISAFKVGVADCSIYLGSVKLYPTEPPTPHDYSQDYFTIVSEEDNNTISLKNTGYSTSTGTNTYWKSVTISASTDGGSTWSGFTTSRNTIKTLGTINKGQKMLLKGNATKFANTSNTYHYFNSTENFSVEGNTLSLFYGDNFLSYDSLPTISSTELKRTMQLGCIFKNNTKLISAENMILPTGTLTLKCYSYMFQNCTSITTAPSSIGTSATTLADYCCNSMFYNCTSLTTAPELPATTLADYCYNDLFIGCSALTTAPELPATTLADGCYGYMFYNCTSLTTAPELPATTLADNCYCWMFRGCTSLTTAPVLSAATLANTCYNGLFNSCTNLNSITCLATDISATNCTNYWVNGVAASGTFTKAASMSNWTSGDNGIPSGWSIQDCPTQWVSYSEGDTVSSSTIYGVKLEDIGLSDTFSIEFGDTHTGVGFIWEDGDWTAFDEETFDPIDITSYYDDTTHTYTILFSDLGYGGMPISYPQEGDQFEFDVQLYI